MSEPLYIQKDSFELPKRNGDKVFMNDFIKATITGKNARAPFMKRGDHTFLVACIAHKWDDPDSTTILGQYCHRKRGDPELHLTSTFVVLEYKDLICKQQESWDGGFITSQQEVIKFPIEGRVNTDDYDPVVQAKRFLETPRGPTTSTAKRTHDTNDNNAPPNKTQKTDSIDETSDQSSSSTVPVLKLSYSLSSGSDVLVPVPPDNRPSATPRTEGLPEGWVLFQGSSNSYYVYKPTGYSTWKHPVTGQVHDSGIKHFVSAGVPVPVKPPPVNNSTPAASKEHNSTFPAQAATPTSAQSPSSLVESPLPASNSPLTMSPSSTSSSLDSAAPTPDASKPTAEASPIASYPPGDLNSTPQHSPPATEVGQKPSAPTQDHSKEVPMPADSEGRSEHSPLPSESEAVESHVQQARTPVDEEAAAKEGAQEKLERENTAEVFVDKQLVEKPMDIDATPTLAELPMEVTQTASKDLSPLSPAPQSCQLPSIPAEQASASSTSNSTADQPPSVTASSTEQPVEKMDIDTPASTVDELPATQQSIAGNTDTNLSSPISMEFQQTPTSPKSSKTAPVPQPSQLASTSMPDEPSKSVASPTVQANEVASSAKSSKESDIDVESDPFILELERIQSMFRNGQIKPLRPPSPKQSKETTSKLTAADKVVYASKGYPPPPKKKKDLEHYNAIVKFMEDDNQTELAFVAPKKQEEQNKRIQNLAGRFGLQYKFQGGMFRYLVLNKKRVESSKTSQPSSISPISASQAEDQPKPQPNEKSAPDAQKDISDDSSPTKLQTPPLPVPNAFEEPPSSPVDVAKKDGQAVEDKNHDTEPQPFELQTDISTNNQPVEEPMEEELAEGLNLHSTDDIADQPSESNHKQPDRLLETTQIPDKKLWTLEDEDNPMNMFRELTANLEMLKEVDWTTFHQSDANIGETFKMIGLIKLAKARLKAQVQSVL